MPFIKRVELRCVLDTGAESINQLIKSCPNLEETKCFLVPSNNSVFQNLLKLKDLKRLKVHTISLQCFLPTPFPNSNIEHLEFDLCGPFKGNLRLFGNLKRLKSVKFTSLHSVLRSYYSKSKLFPNHTSWREIEYSNSFQY
ncbi:hypothetical protein CONCODRAFT_6403 [Conidiobolus coronatus NRRL 28638]|uniref:F-box domain-containing protein n=1 Tax=Conidiobolus coronatus (strain ATCC 28846 / CBS 209.66 / NRRL 28638) TaxID=796925 RepID=A0A137P7J0_CONC2|nr:hypothetical protein CONCODRAFT_6403 [Conidiobolus coronatus NRRL 28638]|eukprot:KXN70955.1 hypothetical protein CONCODRAFT_6403 [Conidiobolus coronatus NRRL 28638]